MIDLMDHTTNRAMRILLVLVLVGCSDLAVDPTAPDSNVRDTVGPAPATPDSTLFDPDSTGVDPDSSDETPPDTVGVDPDSIDAPPDTLVVDPDSIDAPPDTVVVDPDSTGVPPDSAVDPDTAVVDPDPDPTLTGMGLELVADGLTRPVFVTHAPGDRTRVYIVERPGRVRVLHDGELRAPPFLDITSITSEEGEGGLLSIAFHPGFSSNGWVFVNHTDANGDTRIVRYTASSGDFASSASAQLVLDIDQPYDNHNGGQIAFGPDGMLYIGMGDGGGQEDPHDNGQDPQTLLGAMLRIDVNTLPYSIPSSNPYRGSTTGADEVWATGMRNPWRFSFDRSDGYLYIADVGQAEREEVSIVAPSASGALNFGWDQFEGTVCFEGPCSTAGKYMPAFEYTHDEGCSISGGSVYRGSALPQLEGRYFFADFCASWIRSFRRSGTSSVTDLRDHTPAFGAVSRIVSFGEDDDGELYVVVMDGEVYRIVPTHD